MVHETASRCAKVVVVCAAAATLARANLPIGMNITNAVYHTPMNLLIFTDMMKHMSNWVYQDADFAPGGEDVPPTDPGFDEDGYPVEIPMTPPGYSAPQTVHAIVPGHFPPGRYILTYDGDGDFHWYGGGSVVGSIVEVVSSQPGRIVLQYAPKSESGNWAIMWITRSTRGNHVRNIQIIPEELEGSYDPAQPFRPEFLNAVNHLSAVRFMTWMSCNEGRMHGTWAQRVKETHYSQAAIQGTSIDLQIRLCNILELDAWFNVPHMVNDEYIVEFARLVRDNLDPRLTAYLEYSNELWNWGGAFPQSKWIVAFHGRDPDHPEWDAPDSIYNTLVAIGDQGGAHLEMDAYMCQRAFDIWRSEFTGAERQRLVCVGATQLGLNEDRYLGYLYNTTGTWTGSTGNGCDAISGAMYLHGDDDFNAYVMDLARNDMAAARAVDSSLYWVGYEGGSEADQGPTYNYSQEVYDDLMTMWQTVTQPDIDCRLFCGLILNGDEDRYGFLRGWDMVDQPEIVQSWKWRAVKESTTRVPLADYGVVKSVHEPTRKSVAHATPGTRMPSLMVVLKGGRLPSGVERLWDARGRAVGTAFTTRLTGSGMSQGVYVVPRR